jgi:hypothetical protein
MPARTIPRNPVGHVPGKDFIDTGDLSGLKVGIVTRVDEVNMKADLKILTGGGNQYEIDLTQGMTGPRSFWGGVPEVNSLVIVGYRRTHKQLQEAVILGYIPTGNKSGLRFDPFSVDDPSSVDPTDAATFEEMFGPTRRYKRLMLRPGDVGGMSSSGAEFTLTKDVRIANRSGESIELRDADRTLITQAIHRVDTDAGVKMLSGPIRRSAFFLPPDIFQTDGKTLKDSNAPYYGRDELQAAGPGVTPGSATKFANTSGKVLDLFNDTTEFPPVTYTNGRRVHYPPTSPAISIEDPEGSADAFVERRVEMSHTSDLTQEVLEEIDGFSMDRRMPYIEYALGTVVGNSLNSTRDQRQYGRILKPRLFSDFTTNQAGKFTLEEVDRSPTAPDLESITSAGAMLFRIRPPRGVGDNHFIAAVSKQGKLFLNIPGSSVEDYPSGSKNISAEMSLAGALKAYIGASSPDRISLNVTLEGGLHADIGRDAQGNALTINYHSAVMTTYEGNPNENDVVCSTNVVGVKETAISGAEKKTIEGSKQTTVSGQCSMEADRYSVNAFSGASYNFGELNQLVAGKSQLQYALALIETIVLGGKASTILAGGLIQNVVAGAVSYTAAAGAMSFAVPGGAYSVTVGTGAISVTTAAGAVALSTAAGAMSLSAGAGAVSVNAGLALNLAAATTVSIVAPQVLVGGPAAVLGVLRGVASLPPGTPTLDPITGTPLLGSAQFRSI